MSEGLVFDPGNSKQVRAALKKHEPAFLRAAKKGLENLVETWTTDVRSNFTGWYGGHNRTGATPQGRLRTASSDLWQSIGGHVKGSKSNDLRAILRAGGIGDARRYAQIQELGTVGAGGELPDIKARPGGYMTVPTEFALTAGGAKKPAAKLKKRAGVWVTSGMGPTFIDDDAGEHGMIFAKRTPGSRAIPIYTLRKKVAIPPRLGAYRNFNRLQKKAVSQLLDKFILIARGGAA